MQDDSPLDGVVPVAAAFSELPHIFPSPQSGLWFIRQNKVELVETGAILMLGGRWMATKKFPAAVFQIGRAAAEKAAA